MNEGERSNYEVETAQIGDCDGHAIAYLSAWTRDSPGMVDASEGIELFLWVDAGARPYGYLIRSTQTDVPGPGIPVLGEVEFAANRFSRFVLTAPGLPGTLSTRDLPLTRSQDVCKRLQSPFYTSRDPRRDSN